MEAALRMPSVGEQAQVVPFDRGKWVLIEGKKAILIELISYGVNRWQSSKQYNASKAETEYDKEVGLGAAMNAFAFLEHIKEQYGIDYLEIAKGQQ
jgi:hypothetical protein